MVAQVIDQYNVFAFELEGHPPIAIDDYRVMAGQIAAQRMQAPAGQIHVVCHLADVRLDVAFDSGPNDIGMLPTAKNVFGEILVRQLSDGESVLFRLDLGRYVNLAFLFFGGYACPRATRALNSLTILRASANETLVSCPGSLPCVVRQCASEIVR